MEVNSGKTWHTLIGNCEANQTSFGGVQGPPSADCGSISALSVFKACLKPHLPLVYDFGWLAHILFISSLTTFQYFLI